MDKEINLNKEIKTASEKLDNSDKNINNIDADDVTFVDEAEESDPQAVIKKLRTALKASNKERQEYLEGWQRAKADFINSRKEEEKSREAFLKFAEEKLIRRLLPVIESFDLATANKEAWDKLPKDWRLGMEHIYRELQNALSEHGLKALDPSGDNFNPQFHVSGGSRDVSDLELDHKIVEVLQKGYLLSGKVLKPARVIIGEYKSKSSE